MAPIFVVLLYSSLSAGVAALGAGPFVRRRQLPIAAMGWANALAARLLLGAAYVLLDRGLPHHALPHAARAAPRTGFV